MLTAVGKMEKKKDNYNTMGRWGGESGEICLCRGYSLEKGMKADDSGSGFLVFFPTRKSLSLLLFFSILFFF